MNLIDCNLLTRIIFELIDFTRNEYDITDDKKYILDISTCFQISAMTLIENFHGRCIAYSKTVLNQGRRQFGIK